MKKLLPLALLFFAATFSNAQWYKLPGPNGGPMFTVARVGNEIWAGGYGGLYTSSNEGLSWQKSSLINGSCKTILSYNDTVVICYTIVDGFDYSTYSISSFDAGQNWSAPYLLDQPYSFGVGYLKKSDKAIFFFSDFYCDVSLDGGLTWSIGTTPGGDIYEIYTDGVLAIATITLPNPPYEAYYYSADGTAPWTQLSNTGTVNTIFTSNNRIFMIDYMMGVDSMLKTDDFGATWDTVVTGATTVIQSMFKYNNQLYLQGPQDSLVSTDNGLTWSPGTLPDAHWQQPGLFTTSSNWLHVNLAFEISTYFPATDTSVVTNTGIIGYYLSCLYENNNVLFTSGHDHFYRSTDGGISWINIDSVQTTIETMFFQGDSIYAVDQTYGMFARSYDNGVTWFTNSIPTYTGGSKPPGVTRLNGTIYINGYVSFFSNDEGATWDTLLALPPSVGCTGTNDQYGTVVSYFNSLYSIAPSGHLFRYNDATASWDYLHCWGQAGAWPQNFLTQVDNHLVAGNIHNLFISSDSGNTWVESLYGGLPTDGFSYYIPKNIISVNGYWFCTLGSFGVYYSTDYGMSWSAMPFNQEFVPTQGLINFNDVLYTIGFYNGIWRRQNPFFNLSGKVYRDLNNNSIQDTGENGLEGRLLMTTPGNFTATTDATGNYTLISDIPGTISPVIPGFYATINPASYNYSGTASALDFGVYMSPNIYDLNCDITNVNVFSPGFQTNIQLTINNKASLASTPQLKLVLDSALSYNSANPTPDVISGDTLYWNIGVLDFLDDAVITVSVNTGIWSTGDTIHCTLEAYPIIGDSTPIDNISILEEAVVGSYDPNDKTCVEGEYFTPAQLSNNEELQYVIRFQNTGNFPTSFIVVTDTLSPLLDFSTFRMISSSHPCTWTITGWGSLRVEFNPIALPPSSIDEPGSHGYFKYGVKCRNSVVVGNAITNVAAIYFDFNSPIITNTVTTLIFDPVPVTVPEITPSIVHIIPYPNPSVDYIQLKFLNNTYPNTVIINTFDVMGHLIATNKIDPSSGSINISDFSSGIYFSVVSDQKGERLGSFRFTKVK